MIHKMSESALNFQSMADRALREAGEDEPWHGYYFIRGSEIEHIVSTVQRNGLGTVLDMGCGNGYIAYLLASVSKKVIAMDLFSPNPKTHTMGIDITKRFIAKMCNENVGLVSSSMEYMPFKDASFDTVFSSYAFQYVEGRQRALREIRRVTKKGGMIILILPSFVDRLYAFLQFYFYLFMRILRKITGAIFNASAGTTDQEQRRAADRGAGRRNYRDIVFPQPDGSYKNFIVEMVRYMPCQWNRLLREAGFKIVHSLATVFVPYPFMFSLSLKADFIHSELYRRITKLLSDKPLLKYVGYSYCVILKNE